MENLRILDPNVRLTEKQWRKHMDAFPQEFPFYTGIIPPFNIAIKDDLNYVIIPVPAKCTLYQVLRELVSRGAEDTDVAPAPEGEGPTFLVLAGFRLLAQVASLVQSRICSNRHILPTMLYIWAKYPYGHPACYIDPYDLQLTPTSSCDLYFLPNGMDN